MRNTSARCFTAAATSVVFAIQLVLNKRRNVYPCWEATTEPVCKDQDGEWVVHNRHLVLMEDGTGKLLKSVMKGFALAEYSNGDEVDPVRLPFADTCHAKFLERESRLASALTRLPTAECKRRQPATYATLTLTLNLTFTLTLSLTLTLTLTLTLRSTKPTSATKHPQQTR
jgi:hypothetical protein